MWVLIVLLVSQVYWTICSGLLNKINLAGDSPDKPKTTATVDSKPKSKEQLEEEQDRKQGDTDIRWARVTMLATWMVPFLDENTKHGIKSYNPSQTPSHSEADSTIAREDYDPYVFVCVVAEQVTTVMQAWWLPLLYGALGATVYVVRTLSLQARDRLFRKEGLVALNMRIYLGLIGGLGIGWFWKDSPQQPATLAALSPFALAFVAGYGVELLLHPAR